MEKAVPSNTYMKLETFPSRVMATYTEGKIQKVNITGEFGKPSLVEIFLNDEIYSWQSSDIYKVGYMMYGIPVSKDGRFIFAQQDMKGLLCLDTKDGHVIWKTQSKAEYSHVLVGDKSLCCSKSKNEIQLLDIETGSVIKSYKTTFDNRFEVITDRFIVNHTKAKAWDIICSETLEVVQTIPDSIFMRNRRSIELSYINKI